MLARIRHRLAAVAAKDIRERRPAAERHAHRLKRPNAMNRIDRHDVRVQQLRQRSRFRLHIDGHLERHRPPGQLLLFGQEYAAKGPTPKFRHEAEAGKLAARAGHLGRGFRQPQRRLWTDFVQLAKEARRSIAIAGVAIPLSVAVRLLTKGMILARHGGESIGVRFSESLRPRLLSLGGHCCGPHLCRSWPLGDIDPELPCIFARIRILTGLNALAVFFECELAPGVRVAERFWESPRVIG